MAMDPLAADLVADPSLTNRGRAVPRVWEVRDGNSARGQHLRTAWRIEQRVGFTVTAAADGTDAPRPLRGEIEKSGREGRVRTRVELRRAA
jgi:hypothetical protein